MVLQTILKNQSQNPNNDVTSITTLATVYFTVLVTPTGSTTISPLAFAAMNSANKKDSYLIDATGNKHKQ
jgi:hypothetical protein